MTFPGEQAPKPGTPVGVEQKVSWLELFFDLIFVVAFDQLAKRLGDSHTLKNLAAFGLLFVAIWWAWLSNATFAARYGNDCRAYRWGTLAELVSVALIALTLRGDLTETGGFFALGYGLNRLLHAALNLWTARTTLADMAPQALAYSRSLAAAAGLGGVIWLVSALLPAGSGLQVALWVLALAIDMLAPVLVRQHGRVALPHEGHLPERVGLLQIIALGAVVTEIVGGGRRQELSWVTLLPALLSLVSVVCLFRLYFDQARALPLLAAHVAGRQGQMLAWLYGHLPLTLSLVVLGVGVGHGISSADAHEVATQQQFVVWSLVLALATLAFLRRVSLRATSGLAGLRSLDRSSYALGAGGLALAALAFLDLDARQLDVLVAVVLVVVTLVVATDPVTHTLGQIEEKVTEQLEAQATQETRPPGQA